MDLPFMLEYKEASHSLQHNLIIAQPHNALAPFLAVGHVPQCVKFA